MVAARVSSSPLSAEQLARLRAEADEAIQQALVQCATLQGARRCSPPASPGSRYRAEHSVLQAFEVVGKPGATVSVSQVFGSVRGKHSDFARSLRAETREQYFNVQKKLFPFTVDARVVRTVSSSPRVHEAIKWAAYDLFPLPDRADACHYEASGEGVDDHGRPYAFLVTVPAGVPVPSPAATSCVRIASTSALVARPRAGGARGVCDVFATMHNDLRSRHVHRSLHKRLRLSLGAVAALLDRETAMYAWMRSNDGHWRRADEPKDCSLCAKSFSVLRARHDCSVCGRVVCRRCAVKAADVVAASSSGLTAHAKLCAPCVTLLLTQQRTAATRVGHATHHLRPSETPTRSSSSSSSSTAERPTLNWTTNRRLSRARGMTIIESKQDARGWSAIPYGGGGDAELADSAWSIGSAGVNSSSRRGIFMPFSSSSSTTSSSSSSSSSASLTSSTCFSLYTTSESWGEDDDEASVLFSFHTKDMTRVRHPVVEEEVEDEARRRRTSLTSQELQRRLDHQAALLRQLRRAQAAHIS